eukprot:763979-Hanusia_phi.AAC.5
MITEFDRGSEGDPKLRSFQNPEEPFSDFHFNVPDILFVLKNVLPLSCKFANFTAFFVCATIGIPCRRKVEVIAMQTVLLLSSLGAAMAFAPSMHGKFLARALETSSCTRAGFPVLSRARTAVARGPLGLSMARNGDCACTIIGAGRIGTALKEMGKEAGFEDLVVRRGENISAEGSGPIYVTTRNDDLKGVLSDCPPSRKSDLVFYGQNGYIEDFLKDEKVFDDSTKVLVYMAVAKLGDKPTDGITDLNPEGLTAATGKWAEQVAARLRGSGLTCNVLDEDNFRACMFEKHMWICTFMLLGVHHGGITVGEVESKHKEDVFKMVEEMQKCLEVERGIKFKDGVPERLCAYARSVAHFPTALKEFSWRNKFWLDIARAREGKGEKDLTPFHTKLLLKARDDGAVKFD